MKQVWFYTDYRTLIADWLDERKEAGLPASNRFVAQKMGINSTSWLTAILKGDKGLSNETAHRLAAVMHLSSDEGRYFSALVAFNQARSHEERTRTDAELTALRGGRTVRRLADEQFEYYAQWYHAAIRAQIGAFGFDGNYETLAARCIPVITPTQAKQSVALLEKLSMIRPSTQGTWVLCESAVRADDPSRDAVEQYQREAMRLAIESLDRFSPAQRSISTLTVGVSNSTLDRIRTILAEARREIVALANADESADTVWQINMQSFPLCKPSSRKKE